MEVASEIALQPHQGDFTDTYASGGLQQHFLGIIIIIEHNAVYHNNNNGDDDDDA